MSPVLDSLPAEVLSKILSFLSKDDLTSLCQVCRHLYFHCLDDPAWKTLNGTVVNFRPGYFSSLRKSRVLLHGHLSNKYSLKEACRIAHNWRHHIPKDINLKKFRQKLLPWLFLDGSLLYFSQASTIHTTRVLPVRQMRKEITNQGHRSYRGHKKDVVRFAVTESQVISGGRDEMILVWNKDVPTEPIQSIPLPGAVISLDAGTTTVVTGVRDHGIRVLGKDGDYYESKYTVPVDDVVWAVAINPNQRSFTAGSSCHQDCDPLSVFDIERGTKILSCGSNYRRGAGILSLHFQDPSIFLSSGYDCSLNCWDLREPCRVPAIVFPDEDQTFSYSLDSDLDNFIACGLCRFGQIKLWDKRLPSSRIQSFFVGNVGYLGNSSPVYSIKVSATHLFAALSQSLQCMDFTGNLCPPSH